MNILRGMSMNTTVFRVSLLNKLKENRENYLKLYEEAQRGYLEQAATRLRQRLAQIEAGEQVNLRFNLHVPENHIATYDTAIRMLEWNQEEKVTLSASEFRMLVEDEWDWMDQWLVSNSAYSSSTSAVAADKGLL